MLTVQVDGLKEALGRLEYMRDQIPFATALALTTVAKEIQAGMPAELDRALDRPTPFTKSGFYVKAARKGPGAYAEIGLKPITAGYLRKQIFGGVYRPEGTRLKLPSEVQLNQYGNIPKGLIRQLIQRAEAGKRLTKTQSKKSGISRAVDLFYGDPGNGWPEGIYKRTDNGLIPIIVFPRRTATYRKRFDFYGAAQRIARLKGKAAIERSIDRVIETARAK